MAQQSNLFLILIYAYISIKLFLQSESISLLLRDNNYILKLNISQSMNLSTQSLNLYSKLLNISKQNAQQIRNLCEKQTNAVWRSLLKVQYSLQISNHNQAANELKISKSQIMSFMNYNNSKENQKIYQKVFVCVLANLINRLIMATKYGEALECFEQLNNALKDKTILKQALHNLFGFTSLVSLDSYNIQNNSEFKYSPETQAKFFYIVGKIKKLTYKTQEAKVLFEKILKIKETCDLNILIVSKVYYYLAQIDQVKYNSEFSKIKKSYQSLCEHVYNQDKVSQQMIKTLLNKQTLLNKENRSLLESQKMEPKINKVMLKMYLQKLSRDQKNISFETQKYLKQLFQALKQDSNHSTLQQIMKSPEAKEAGVYFNQNINKIFKIVPKYYGRKLLDKITVNRKINSPTNSSIIQSNSPYKSAISKTQIKRDRSIPEDKIRAEKILKKCCDGSYLIKINFGSKSYVKKFVRIQQKGLKWADNQIQMQSTSSACKWKHVLGIVYGKVSENFTKTKFKAFQSHRCFSLITKERSYDFYCDNESDIYFWLQGISYKLQLFHNNSKTYPFYSKARAIWKMMLLKMGTKYYDAKKKYKCGNAGAVLGFKKYLMIQK